jgi:8-oxo-dGTP pyrophosphatase MutT (NUDIX family)
MIKNRPKVGMGIFIVNKNLEFLIGKRKDVNLYGLPGRHLELFEELNEAIARETVEETNLVVDSG